MVTIPKTVSERLKKQVRRFKRVLKNAQARDVNESDTVTIVTDMLAVVFGFDKYTEITSEQTIRGTYCDLAVQIDGSVKYLLEVKAIGLHLKENHLRQTVNYGANQGTPWVVLTNGIHWELYRILFERPIGHELVCTFNFLELNLKKREDQDRLFLLCKEGMSKAAIDKFHEHVQIVNRYTIAAILQSDPLLGTVRRELRRISKDVRVEKAEIQRILVAEVLRRSVVEGDEAAKAKRRVRRAAGRKLLKKKSKNA